MLATSLKRELSGSYSPYLNGIGLSISKAIIEKHGGQLKFDSVPNQGTTFYFDLPELARQSEPLKPILPVIEWLSLPLDPTYLLNTVIQAAEATGLPLDTVRPRLLFIENDPDLVSLLELTLQEVAEVSYAVNLAEAREQLSAGPLFDLIILDLVLPDGSGLELLPLLISPQAPNVPAILLLPNEASSEIRQEAAALVKSRTSQFQPTESIKELKAKY